MGVVYLMRCCLDVGICLLIVCLGFKCWWNVGLGCLGWGLVDVIVVIVCCFDVVVISWFGLIVWFGLFVCFVLILLCLVGYVCGLFLCVWWCYLFLCYLDLCGFVYISCVVLLCGLAWLLGFDFCIVC